MEKWCWRSVAVKSTVQASSFTGCVDLVMTFEVIEHLDQGESMMAEIARVLRPGGIVIISTPHHHQSSELFTQQNTAQLNPDFMSACESLLRSKFRNVSVFPRRTALASYVVPLANKPVRSEASCTSLVADFIFSQKERSLATHAMYLR